MGPCLPFTDTDAAPQSLLSPKLFQAELPHLFGLPPVAEWPRLRKPSRLELWIRGLLDRWLGRRRKAVRP